MHRPAPSHDTNAGHARPGGRASRGGRPVPLTAIFAAILTVFMAPVGTANASESLSAHGPLRVSWTVCSVHDGTCEQHQQVCQSLDVRAADRQVTQPSESGWRCPSAGRGARANGTCSGPDYSMSYRYDWSGPIVRDAVLQYWSNDCPRQPEGSFEPHCTGAGWYRQRLEAVAGGPYRVTVRGVDVTPGWFGAPRRTVERELIVVSTLGDAPLFGPNLFRFDDDCSVRAESLFSDLPRSREVRDTRFVVESAWADGGLGLAVVDEQGRVLRELIALPVMLDEAATPLLVAGAGEPACQATEQGPDGEVRSRTSWDADGRRIEHVQYADGRPAQRCADIWYRHKPLETRCAPIREDDGEVTGVTRFFTRHGQLNRVSAWTLDGRAGAAPAHGDRVHEEPLRRCHEATQLSLEAPGITRLVLRTLPCGPPRGDVEGTSAVWDLSPARLAVATAAHASRVAVAHARDRSEAVDEDATADTSDVRTALSVFVAADANGDSQTTWTGNCHVVTRGHGGPGRIWPAGSEHLLSARVAAAVSRPQPTP